MSAALRTAVAETVVPASRPLAYAAVGRPIDLLWGGRSDVVRAEPPTLLVHTVVPAPGSDDVDAWLTWEFAPATSEASTEVRLTCDEADTSEGPAPELDGVLRLLMELTTRSEGSGLR